jgi:hypothetical protein
MGSVLTKLKNESSGKRQPSNRHDLESAIDRAGDARDMARDLLRRLPDYDGSEEEDTARHDMGARQTITHVHIHQSQPEIEVETAHIEVGPVKVSGLPRWAVVGIAAIIATGAALLAHFAH